MYVIKPRYIYIYQYTYIYIYIYTYIYKSPDRSGQADAFIDGRRYGPIVSSYKTGRLDETPYVGGWTQGERCCSERSRA